MSKGNSIIVNSEPRGRKIEGYVNAALKPGTVVQIDVSEGRADTGRLDWEAYNTSADGEQRVIAVLLEDWGKGKLMTDAYVSGDLCNIYFPLPGDELNMLVSNIAGTGDVFALGDILMVNDGDGELIATTGSPESEPFIALEAAGPLTADTLVWCMFTGY